MLLAYKSRNIQTLVAPAIDTIYSVSHLLHLVKIEILQQKETASKNPLMSA